MQAKEQVCVGGGVAWPPDHLHSTKVCNQKPHSPWFLSLNKFQNWSFKSSSNKMNQHDPLALHTFCGWLAYVLFLTYHLDACEQISLGPHAHLSSWCVWYGLTTWSSLLMLKYLGNFIWNKKKLAKLLFDLPKSYQSHIMNHLENPIHILLVFALSIVKLLWPLEEFFSCFMIKIHVHTLYPPCYASMRS